MLHQWSDYETNPALLSAIDLFLAKQGLLEIEKARLDIGSTNLVFKASGIIALLKSDMDYPAAEKELQQLLNSPNEEICMGLVILGTSATSHNIETLLPFLKHPSLKTARIAASSMTKIADVNAAIHGPVLIAHLTAISDNEIRLSLLKALGKMEDISSIHDIISTSIHFRPNERRMTESIIFDMGMGAFPYCWTSQRTLACTTAAASFQAGYWED